MVVKEKYSYKPKKKNLHYIASLFSAFLLSHLKQKISLTLMVMKAAYRLENEDENDICIQKIIVSYNSMSWSCSMEGIYFKYQLHKNKVLRFRTTIV